MDYCVNNKRQHPRLSIPPVAHALQTWDEPARTLSYEYNGTKIIAITIPGDSRIGYRQTSDGDLLSRPLTQQVYVMQEGDRVAPVTAKVVFRLSCDAVNMRPHRAGREQAILGQVGRPLIQGVNGLYDIEQDLLIDWNGAPWRWTQAALTPAEDGSLTAWMDVELGAMPWFVNLRMHYYRAHLGFKYHMPWKRRPNLKPVAGWCSWEAFRRSVSQKDVEEAADLFSRTLKPYGFEYVQIDDGYQSMPIPPDPRGTIADSWLNPNKQFPGGHEAAVSAIKKAGLQPGIWTNCSLTNPAFAEAQSGCLLKDREGKHLKGDWIDFVLDCRRETLERHVIPYYRGLKDKGYTYFKTDALRHLLLDGMQEAVRLGLMSNEDAEARFRAFMEAAREGLGEDAYFLSSWGVLAEVAGMADACRIAMDANPTWAGVRMQLVESARWFHTQRILFLNDPDHVCVRAKLEWVRSVCSLVSLTGGLYMLSDAPDVYQGERLRIIRRTLPPLATVAGETGPLDLTIPAFTWTKLHGFAVPRENAVRAQDASDEEARRMAGLYPTMHDAHPFSSLWAFHLCTPFKTWCVVGRFATAALPASELRVESLGLDPARAYLVFDFWKEQCLGVVSETLACPALEHGQCQILAFSPVLDHPQCIASTRHVSMDAVSIQSQEWRDHALILSLRGVPGTAESYWFHIPVGLCLRDLAGDGCSARFTQRGEICKADVAFEKEQCHLVLRVNE